MKSAYINKFEKMYKYRKNCKCYKKVFMEAQMNKVIITMICILVIIGAILTGFMIYDKNNDSAAIESTEIAQVPEKVTDECTEEYEQMQLEDLLETTSDEEKISPNCSLILNRYYVECGHTIQEYKNIPETLVNKTREELQEEYENWEIEKFSTNEIILYRQFDSECGEHYIVKDKDGKVTIFNVLDDGIEEEIEQTDISTEYLPEEDKNNIINGIRVNTKQELNQLIENFE